MNRLFVLIFIVSIIALFTTGCSIKDDNIQNTEEVIIENQPIKLGYCPTMVEIAKMIQEKNQHVSLVPYDFTAQALQSLNKKEVDVVLVGRIAENNELGEVFEKRLKDGLTLVGREKMLIRMDDLQKSRIHTYVTKEQAQEYIPNTDKIIYHDSFESAIKEGINDAVLIKWSDFSDDFELIIPVDENMNKIEKFRIPVLYSYNKENITKP